MTAVRAAVPPEIVVWPCRVKVCCRAADRLGGLCAFHRDRRRLAIPAHVEWQSETPSAQASRHLVLDLTDRLLGQLEELSAVGAAAGPAPPGLVVWYEAVGGGPVWSEPWPQSSQLADAILGLQEDLVRKEVRRR